MPHLLPKRTVDPVEAPRDELFSHIQRCGVLAASAPDQKNWLADTMQYIRERYPNLTDLQLASLKAMGRRYLAPVIPHGSAYHNLNRKSWDPLLTPSSEQALARAG